MQEVYREVLHILLERMYRLDLVSQFTYEHGEEQIHLQKDFPEYFRIPNSLAKEEDSYGSCKNPQGNAPGKIHF